MSKKVYEIVTQRIMEKLKEGVVPWRRPFQSHSAVNWLSQRAYRGINTLLLEPGEYATFNQIRKNGGKVKKGEKSHLAVLWKWIEIEDEEDEEKVINVPFLRYYRVFEINTQVEGLESRRRTIEYKHDPIKEAEKIIEGFIDRPRITFNHGRAYYNSVLDIVNVPNKSEFESIHEYYSTLFHELVHSTGHKDRLNREGITELTVFGDQKYSREELISEIGATMLCGIAGIENKTIDNSTSYIQSWLRALENDHTLIVHASQQAQKASDYILGDVREVEQSA